MSYLLDTNVVAELHKGLDRADPSVIAWLATVAAQDTHISVITLQEIHAGAARKGRTDRAQGERLVRWARDVERTFAGRILDVTPAVAVRAGEILGSPQAPGLADALIGATALVHRMPVATRNTKDLARTGAAVVDPWEYR